MTPPRLGLRLPPPYLVYHLEVDTSRFELACKRLAVAGIRVSDVYTEALRSVARDAGLTIGELEGQR